MNDIDTNQLVALFAAHKWVPFAALVIGLLIRLQKADKLPGLGWIPANYRPWLALALGVASGVLNKVTVDSKTWPVAVLDGLLSALIAITAHDTLIEGVRGGKEILGGGSKNPDPTPTPAGGPDALASKDPPPGTGIGPTLVWVILGAAITLAGASLEAGCGYGKTACQVIDVAHENCSWLRYLEADGTVREVPITQEEAREFGRTMQKRQSMKNADASAPDASSDGGGK